MSGATAGPILEVKGSLPRDPRLYIRDHGTFLREALKDAARFHHERHIPRHFEPFARAKYGYTSRSERYQKLKKRRGLPDLVWSGRTRAVVTQSRQITGTQKQARLILRLPFKGGTGRLRVRGARLSAQQQNVLRIIAELQAIAADELKAVAGYVRDDYTRRANEPGTRYRIRKKG
ncbi:MAG TPA: hypothetical protein DCQ94_06810 [Nitrospira sp.]|nr:hypothetical protein [Nitrospira sp.]